MGTPIAYVDSDSAFIPGIMGVSAILILGVWPDTVFQRFGLRYVA